MAQIGQPRVLSTPGGGGMQMQPAGTTMTGGGGADYEPLRQYLGQMAIKKGQASTAWDILGPEKESAETEKLRKGKEKAQRILDQMEKYYFENKLAKGFPYGLMDEVEARVTPNTPYSRFKKLSKSSRVDLARAAGDVGNLALQEQMAQEALIPNALYDNESAQEMFNLARERFGLPIKNYSLISKKK